MTDAFAVLRPPGTHAHAGTYRSHVAETLPLFPLGTVLMPGASLPLHIFEPRYRQLTVDLVTGAVPGKEFGVVAVREGWTPDDDGIDGLHTIGCTAELRDVRRLPDGRYDVVTRGARRFRLLDLDSESKQYLMGSVEFLPDVQTDAERGADAADMTRMLSAVGPRRTPPLLRHRVEARRLVGARGRRRAGHACPTCSPPTACCPIVRPPAAAGADLTRPSGCGWSAACSPARLACSPSCARSRPRSRSFAVDHSFN